MSMEVDRAAHFGSLRYQGQGFNGVDSKKMWQKVCYVFEIDFQEEYMVWVLEVGR